MERNRAGGETNMLDALSIIGSLMLKVPADHERIRTFFFFSFVFGCVQNSWGQNIVIVCTSNSVAGSVSVLPWSCPIPSVRLLLCGCLLPKLQFQRGAGRSHIWAQVLLFCPICYRCGLGNHHSPWALSRFILSVNCRLCCWVWLNYYIRHSVTEQAKKCCGEMVIQ